MTPAGWREVEELFQSVVDQEPDSRKAYLDKACKDDLRLRRDVDSLLELNDSPVIVDVPAWQVVPELLEETELPPGTDLGPYRIEALLGAGGMGRVYRAHDTRLGRSVAIKIPAFDFKEGFEREARTIAALNHPGICTLHDVGPDYLVMELVDGPTLADRIAQGPVPLDEALRYCNYIAAALECAHEQGIVHLDLKPANIKIKPDGTVKVLDFGLARLIETPGAAAGADSGTTPALEKQIVNGTILGTPAYMSPEQARGTRIDKRADIWAFGVVLHEMLTGRPLFQRERVSDTLAAVVTHEPDFDRVPLMTRNLLRRCLEKDPKRRLRDIGDAMPLLQDQPPAMAPPVRLRRWIWPTAALLSIVTLLAVSLIHFREAPSTLGERVRFQMPLPEGVTLSPESTFAVSPDGRRLAFFATGSDGSSRLWIHDMDSPHARLMPVSGISDASPPFWSPDSRYLAFESEGKLKKINAQSGALQALCDVPMGVAGGSWSRDGVVIFATASQPSIVMRVSAAGGMSSAVTRSHGPATRHSYPTFLPDGRHFLYVRVGRGPGIYVGSLDVKPEDQESRPLLQDYSNALYVPSPNSATGHLLYVREGNLLAQPFDPARLALTGEAVTVAGQVSTRITTAWGAFSAAANGLLVYRSGDPNRKLAWLNQQGQTVDVVQEIDRSNQVSLSPDLTRVAVTQGAQIWLRDLVSGALTQLTFGPGQWNSPIWAPDGMRVTFSKPPNELHRKAANGAGDDELIVRERDTNYLRPTDWSPDGRYLLYTNVDPKTRADIWVLADAAAASPRRTFPIVRTDSVEHRAVFSPDAHWIAYVSDESGSEEIYVTRFPESFDGSTGAGGKWRVSYDGGVFVRWRRDGKQLLYERPDGYLIAVDVVTQPVFRADSHRTLFRADSMAWDVTPDGKRFLVSLPPPNERLVPFTVLLNWQTALRQ